MFLHRSPSGNPTHIGSQQDVDKCPRDASRGTYRVARVWGGEKNQKGMWSFGDFSPGRVETKRTQRRLRATTIVSLPPLDPHFSQPTTPRTVRLQAFWSDLLERARRTVLITSWFVDQIPTEPPLLPYFPSEPTTQRWPVSQPPLRQAQSRLDSSWTPRLPSSLLRESRSARSPSTMCQFELLSASFLKRQGRALELTPLPSQWHTPQAERGDLPGLLLGKSTSSLSLAGLETFG